MPNLVALLAPTALLLPMPASDDIRSGEAKLAAEAPVKAGQVTSREWVMLEGINGVPVQYQIRIQQRVVIRVAPARRPSARLWTATW